jgi:hypothetical protein
MKEKTLGKLNFFLALSICFTSFSGFFTVAIPVFSGPVRGAPKYYSNENNYKTVEAIIVEDDEYDVSGVFTVWNIKLLNESRNSSRFSLADGNLDILEKNNFWSEIEIGDIIDITTSFYIFGDGWHYPIVEIKKGEKTYLELNDGIMNLVIDSKNSERESMLQTIPFIIISVICISFLIFSILLKRKFVINDEKMNQLKIQQDLIEINE